MLVLSRKANEKLVIDGGIIVTIVAIEGNKVRIGITAPPHVRIDREEVHARRNNERHEDAWLGRSEVFVG